MNVIRATTITVSCFVLTMAGLVVAQDDGFESLLQEISQPSPTQQPAGAESTDQVSQPPAGEPAASEPAASEPVVTEDPAPEASSEIVAEPAPEETMPAESAPVEEAPAAAPADDIFAAPAATEPAVTESEPSPAPVDVNESAMEETMPGEATPPSEPPAEVIEDAFTPTGTDAVITSEPPAEMPAAEVTTSEETAPAAEPAAEVASEEESEENVAEPTPAEAEEMARQEEIRRQARETQARKTLDSGLQSAEVHDYDKAIKDLEAALADLPDRPANREIRAEARAKLADAYYRKATAILNEKGNLTEALLAAEKSREYGHRDAEPLIERIKKEQQRQEEIAKRPIPPKERKEYKDKQAEINDLLTQGRQFYKIQDYNAAEALYEKVLLQDEYNVEAMRYLRKIDEVRYKIKTTERKATEADMIQKVRDAWNPPIRQDVMVPGAVVTQTTIEKKTGAQKLQDKMEKITFPLIDFRQANIIDVVKFLNDESANLDPDKVGVNIILNLNIPGAGSTEVITQTQEPAPTAPSEDLFGGGTTTTTAEPFGGTMVTETTTSGNNAPTITLSLRRVSLLNAIKYITEVANLKYRIDEDAVIITPEGVVQGRVVTRLYPVQPTFLDVVVDKGESAETQGSDRGEFVAMGTTSTTIHKTEVKEFFERSGVPFPAGTSITFNPTISQLIVANTPENLEKFERILSQINVIPNQVEIEARFVEIAQDDLEELGMQWILTDNYELAQKNGNGSVASRERIQVNKDTEGFTKALRFFEFGTGGDFTPNSAAQALNPVGDIATIASVLTNPELTVIIQALSQHGGSDLLSAPRVTTRSGVNAQIQVVREIIYPTEFETTQPQFSNSAGDTQIVTPPLVTPGSFETRQTGVILNVTPTVGPDGYTIDLTLVPEVTELVDWINYGSQFGEFVFNIPQPVFDTRQVTTSIVIWDGQTVVMGGLIREDLIKVHDKIPILGDIPLIGRLFRSEGEYSKKKNLLIFVTARLVDPAGKTIHKAGEVGVGVVPVEPAAPEATETL